MLAEERALTSGALWTKPMIGDWRQPGTPLSIRTLLKRLYPAAKTDADLVLLGAFAIARCFGSAHQLSVAVVCREVKPVGKPDGFSRTFRGSGGEDHASSQEIETGAAIALALDQLESIDIAFDRPSAIGQAQCCFHCVVVSLYPFSQALQFSQLARFCRREPRS